MRKLILFAIVGSVVAWLWPARSRSQSFYDGTNPVLSANSPQPISTMASNRIALGNINVGPSPFQMTNPFPFTAVLFIGGGTLTAFGVNGTAVAAGLSYTGITTVILQPGEWATITYSAAPTVKWKPL